MTLDFYDLKEEPFGFLPDSRFLYLSAAHRQALTSVLRALQADCGFVALLARAGVGKTTLLFHTLNSLGDRVITVYLFQAPRTPVDLLRAVLADLGVSEIEQSEAGMAFQLREVLLHTHRLGKRVVIVIDEAQNLDAASLDLLCTLPNLATVDGKLIQFVFCGRPLLADKLAAVTPNQPMERGVAARLEPFSPQETAEYLAHRLRTAGYRRQSPLFTPEASLLVARYSQGTPRIINHLCFETLSLAYRYRHAQIEADTVHEAAVNLDLAPSQPKGMIGGPRPECAATQSGGLAPSRLSAPKRNSPIAVRSLLTDPVRGFAIAAALFLVVTATIVGAYQAPAVRVAGKQTTVALIKAAPAPTTHAALAPPVPVHDLKAMDLQSALLALSTRKQRQQQDQIARAASASR